MSASIEPNCASTLCFFMILSIFEDAPLSILSEFHFTDEELLKRFKESENQNSSAFILKKIFWFESWQIEECSLSFECLGLLQTKFFDSKSESTSSIKIYNILGKKVIVFNVIYANKETIEII